MPLLTRFGLFCAVLALLVLGTMSGAVATVQAAPDNCYGLNAEACALVNASSSAEALRKLSAFNMDYDIALKVDGGRKETNLDFSVKGSGPFQLERETLGKLAQGDANTVLSSLLMANTLAANLTANGVSSSGNLEFRIVNDLLYFQGDKVTGGKWKSVELKNSAQGGRNNISALRLNPIQALRGLAEFNKLRNTPGLIKAEHSADLTIDGQTVAVFTYQIDLPTLFNSPDLVPLLRIALGTRAGLENIKPEQIKQTVSTLAATFKDTKLSITRLVGTSDKLAHGIGIDFVSTLDPNVMTPLVGGGSPSGSDVKPLNINFHFLIKLSGIGNPANVSAPTDATPFDFGSVNAVPTIEATAAR